MSNPHTVVIEALNAAIQSAVVKSTRDLLAAISADYGIDLGELNDKYMKGLPEEFLPKKKKSDVAKTPCSAINKKKKPCMRFATEGSCYCKLHVRFFAENPDRVTFAEQQQSQDVAAAVAAPKRGATAAARAALVSPDNRSLRRNFDEVFDEVFMEETEDEDARTVTDTEEESPETEIEIDEETEPEDPETEIEEPETEIEIEEPEPEEPMKTPEEPMKTPEEPMKTPEEPTPEEPMKTPEEPTPEEPRKPQCVAINEKKKQRCKRPAANGSCYCKKHEPADDDDDLEKMLERALFGHEQEMI
jgi:hypothetical protein